MARSDFAFNYRFRVRYAELDPQGVVFNSRYLEYADMLLTEFYQDRIRTIGSGKFETHVVRALVTYSKPMRLDEEIDGLIGVSKFGRSSLTYAVELHGAERDDLRARLEMTYVHVDLASGKPIPVPEAIREALGR